MAHKVLQLRRDTAANWAANNPTLASAEAGIETDTRQMKIGDGTTAWNDLGYFGDGNAIHSNVAGEIAAVTEKETPADADVLLIEDSADGNKKKKIQILNLPAGNGGNGFTSKCRAYLSSPQSLTAATFTKIQFDSEDYDTDSEYDSVTNFRFIAGATGYYNFSAFIGYAVIPNGGVAFLFIKKNGDTWIGAVNQRLGSDGVTYFSISGDIYLTAGEYLEVYGYLTGTRNTDHTYGDPYFCVHRFA